MSGTSLDFLSGFGSCRKKTDRFFLVGLAMRRPCPIQPLRLSIQNQLLCRRSSSILMCKRTSSGHRSVCWMKPGPIGFWLRSKILSSKIRKSIVVGLCPLPFPEYAADGKVPSSRGPSSKNYLMLLQIGSGQPLQQKGQGITKL